MITLAQRSDYTRKIRASNPAAAVGLRYERKVVKQLKSQFSNRIEHNAWFQYVKDNNRHLCAPDIVFHVPKGDQLVVIEIKYTYTHEAFEKLVSLYCPVVEKALDMPVGSALPLVIFRNATLGAPKVHFDIMSALRSDPPLLQWLGHGQIDLGR